ncbi:MAG: hypothetical protein ACKPKO_31210, partial [Candidatus Fonsibacter sp.]
QLRYDMIILDESESHLAHFNEQTMSGKGYRHLELIRRAPESQRQYDPDGRRHQRQVAELCQRIRRYHLHQQQEHGRANDHQLDARRRTVEHAARRQLAHYCKQDPRFRVCIVSQSSTKVVVMETELRERYPHLNIKRLIGSDSGETKRRALEDINETLEDVNVFLYSPVIELGMDITVKVKKVFGMLSSSSNSQRAFLQMINRCRCVEDPNKDFLNDGRLKINSKLQLLEVR